MENKFNNININNWGIDINTKPVVIAGPCSAETEEQVINTAFDLQKKGIKIFRAGIWKPRTRPDSFEGVGHIGLEWLKTVKQETGMLTATEVANVKHLYQTLRAGIDILWIGARTSANPFAMQEIADVLKGTDMTVLVKNPVNPDTDLWIGALERLNKAGISKIGAIHRGFSGFSNTKYRNTPLWQIPIELKKQLPDIPMFCDPSHICGNRELLPDVSQKAMDFDFDGLMIESHNNPDSAWSDAKQQITPHEVGNLLDSLSLNNSQPNKKRNDTLFELRNLIDIYDNELMEILEKRMEITRSIGIYKKTHEINVIQNKRWNYILKRNVENGITHDLSKKFVTKLFKTIHQESIHNQLSMLNKK